MMLGPVVASVGGTGAPEKWNTSGGRGPTPKKRVWWQYLIM